MKCENISQLLSPYQDKECDPKTTAEILAHLKKCFQCRKEWNMMGRVVSEIKGLENVEPANNFIHSVMIKVKDQKRTRILPVPSIIYSFVFILFFFLGFFLFQNLEPQPIPEIKNPTMVQLLMESQQMNKLNVQNKTIELLDKGENNDKQ